ncbi:MAG: hypothetical protein VKP62_03570 [Candidatus Sericytochromatia bacterium]|nr:hypothetical protein [Candidatus Sericytochromatia bacterium]
MLHRILKPVQASLTLLIAMSLGGCLLPQPDTPIVPPLLGGLKGAPMAAAPPLAKRPDLSTKEPLKQENTPLTAGPLTDGPLTAAGPALSAPLPSAAASAAPIPTAGDLAASVGSLEPPAAPAATMGSVRAEGAAQRASETVSADELVASQAATITAEWPTGLGVGLVELRAIATDRPWSFSNGQTQRVPAGDYRVSANRDKVRLESDENLRLKAGTAKRIRLSIASETLQFTVEELSPAP